jgi:hypothetical protein
VISAGAQFILSFFSSLGNLGIARRLSACLFAVGFTAVSLGQAMYCQKNDEWSLLTRSLHDPRLEFRRGSSHEKSLECFRPALWPTVSPGSLSPRSKLSVSISPYIFMVPYLIRHTVGFTLTYRLTLCCFGCDLQNQGARHVTLSWLWDSVKLQTLQKTRRYAVPFSAVRRPWNARYIFSIFTHIRSYVITTSLKSFRRT